MEHPNRTHTHWLGKGLMSLLAIVALVLTVAAPALAVSKTAYGVYDEGTRTLELSYALDVPEGENVFPIREEGYKVSWGDAFVSPKAVHITGTFREYEPHTLKAWFADMDELTQVTGTENINMSKVESTEECFKGCTSLEQLDLAFPDTPAIGNMSRMFANCSSLKLLNLATFNTIHVYNMKDVFSECMVLKSVRLGDKFTFKGDPDVTPMDDATEPHDAGGILPTPATEYGTWWRGSGKAYTPEEMRDLTGADIAGTWTWYTGETPTKPAPMFRLYNPNTGEHFYTGSPAERKATIAAGWNDEGIGWYAPTSSKAPVYRLYNENCGGEHHYTTSPAERKALIAQGWNDEGIGWYSDDAQSVPVLREYNPNQIACNHNFTTNRVEHDMLVGLGWRDEGIAWYGVR